MTGQNTSKIRIFAQNCPLLADLISTTGQWSRSFKNGVDEPLGIDKETWPLFKDRFLPFKLPSTSFHSVAATCRWGAIMQWFSEVEPIIPVARKYGFLIP